MSNKIGNLLKAEEMANQLFDEVFRRKLVTPRATEKEINQRISDLEFEMFGIRKYWHKRIVRAGANSMLPYRENPPNLTIRSDDIIFFDFGPVFEDFEADVGRTYVLGGDPIKHRLKKEIDEAWYIGKQYYDDRAETITGADLFAFTRELATRFGWVHRNEHCGHLIGNFPHEKIQGDEKRNYLCPENSDPLALPDQHGEKRYWIYEIHFVDPDLQIGGFFEHLLICQS